MSMKDILLTAGTCVLATSAARASIYDTAVEAASPLPYYNLASFTSTTTTDAVNGYTMTLNNGAVVTPGAGPVINGAAAPALVLANGLSGQAYASSGGSNPESGGIAASGSIIAWIDLASLPSADGRYFSIAGSSAYGDDLDLLIDPTANQLRFYTDGGSYTGSATDFSTASLGQWIFVAATFTAGGARDVYINGVADDDAGTALTAGGHSATTNPYYIGQSNLFGDRHFDGSIADVAFYGSKLSGSQITAIYDSAFVTPPTGVPEPANWALMLVGVGGLGAVLRRSRTGVAPA